MFFYRASRGKPKINLWFGSHSCSGYAQGKKKKKNHFSFYFTMSNCVPQLPETKQNCKNPTKFQVRIHKTRGIFNSLYTTRNKCHCRYQRAEWALSHSWLYLPNNKYKSLKFGKLLTFNGNSIRLVNLVRKTRTGLSSEDHSDSDGKFADLPHNL